MLATDYLEAVAGLPPGGRLELSGAAAATPWDPDLATVMRRHGVAVHEEALLASLMADLG
jgi:hypothetical protein